MQNQLSSGHDPRRVVPDAIFVASFSNPAFWARFWPKPQLGWAIFGKGEVAVNGASLTLRGRRPRPFRTSARHQISIPLSDIFNVVRDGRYIHCHVQIPYMKDRPLRIWLKDIPSALRLVQFLPTRRAVVATGES